MEKSTKNIALTGGGSGGHVIPLVSVHNYIKEVQRDEGYEFDYKFIWVGERDSLESELAEKNKIPFFEISAGKIRRYFDMRNFYEPLKNLTGFFEWLYHIYMNDIDIVFSKGGYVSMPLCIAAWVMRKKVYIHESDTVTGLANTVVTKVATKVFYSFQNDKVDDKKHIYSGPVINPELIDSLDSLEVEENERLNVIVIAGSQGSANIFEALLKILPDMKDIDFQVILGEKNMHFRDDFKDFSNVTLHDFITQKRLWKILKNTDIALTRGSSAIWELYYFGIHSIMIPLKATGGNHQYHNAMYFKEHFGSDVLDEEENLNLEMFRLIQKYKHLRKSGLNIDGFFDGLKKIETEMEL